MAILTQAQLINQLGGDSAAAQLLPDRTTGGIDFTKLDQAIADAVGDVKAALGSRYVVEEANPSAKIVRIARMLGAYYAWAQVPTKVMPETVRQLRGAASQDLRDIENSVSLPGESARGKFVYGVDNSSGGRRWTDGTLRRAGILGAR